MSTHAGASGQSHVHVSPVRLYVIIWVALMVFTAITVGVAQVDFGSLNIVVAMTVATIKASLVVLFFMHLKYDKPFHAVAFSLGIVFFGLFLGLMLLDVGTRTDPEPAKNFAVIPTPTPFVAPAHGSGGAAATEHSAAPAGEKKEAPAAAAPEKSAAPAAGEKKNAPAASPSAAPTKAAEHK
ncbi:MAG: cytochrome C oxidase subunit IV family protein [Blastocatellia bacterium]